MRNFHTQQDEARKQSRRLIAMFVAAVCVLLLLTNLIVAFLFIGFDPELYVQWQRTVSAAEGANAGQWLRVATLYVTGPLFPVISVGVLGSVGVATLIKSMQLSAGGHKVAQMLGGERLDPAATDPIHRKILNVVEEMAIASGTPVPGVYLMPEPAINAFAAGFSVDDAVIGVTLGAAQRLTRAELQGVIGHEFSHILNGDMRLNMRLIAMIGGIVFIATAGRVMMQASGRGRRNSKDAAPIVLLGLALLVLGWVGVLSGRLIKASLSRQREYLADASAVQFTRNPAGLAGALKKIAGLPTHGMMRAPKAEEASHLFIAQAVREGFSGLFATHPPLGDRIRRLDPGWNGQVSATDPDASIEKEWGVSALSEAAVQATNVDAEVGAGAIASAPIGASGIPVISEEMLTLVRKPKGAVLVVLSILNRFDPQVRDLVARSQPSLSESLNDVVDAVARADERLMVPLLELAMPALRMLDQPNVERLRALLTQLYRQDGRLDLVEIMVGSMLERQLPGGHFKPRDALPKYRQLDAVRTALVIVVSALLGATNADAAMADRRLAAINSALKGALKTDLRRDELTVGEPDWEQVMTALARLRRLYPLRKPLVMKAFSAALDDGVDRVEMVATTLSLLAGALDCPWLPAQDSDK